MSPSDRWLRRAASKTRVLWGLLCVAYWSNACAPEGRERGGAGDDRATHSASLETAPQEKPTVQWIDAPDSTERSPLDSLLTIAQQQYGPRGRAFHGEVHRFGPPAKHEFLLVAWVPGPAGTDDSGTRVSLFVLTAVPGRLSAPSKAFPGALDRFSLQSIRDVDGDGAVDVEYCVWSGKPQQRGIRAALGFRDSGWHDVSLGDSFCEPQANI